MKISRPRKWNDKITSVAMDFGFIPYSIVGFYIHKGKSIVIDLSASGDDRDSVTKNILKQLLDMIE